MSERSGMNVAAGESSQEARLRELWAQGLTLKEIGAALGVTRQRAHQLLDQHRLPRSGRRERRLAWLVEHRGEQVVAAFLRSRDDAHVGDELGCDAGEVQAVVDLLVPDARVLRRRRSKSYAHYSDRELRDCLRAAAAIHPSPLTHHDYNAWAARAPLPGGRPRPGHQTAALRWGSWRGALKEAGLPHGLRRGPTSALTRPLVIAAVAACWRELGRPPTVDEYESWAAGRIDRPSIATARKFVDGWADACVSAWEVVHGIPLPRADRDPATTDPP